PPGRDTPRPETRAYQDVPERWRRRAGRGRPRPPAAAHRPGRPSPAGSNVCPAPPDTTPPRSAVWTGTTTPTTTPPCAVRFHHDTAVPSMWAAATGPLLANWHRGPAAWTPSMQTRP